MRNPIACVPCRSAKQKCLHDGPPPCERCRSSGKTEQCQFPEPGTSAIHRKPKRPRISDDTEHTPASQAGASSLPNPGRRNDAKMPNGLSGSGSSPTSSAAAQCSPNAASLLDGQDPFDLLTDEVKNSYLRCSYKWSFHHAPTLLLRIRNRDLEPWMAWAILALASRFVKDPPAPFRTQTEASNAYAAHARQMLQSDLETPSISRVQALLMLTGHDWGAGNGRRAWIYLGMAIRLCEVMDLTQETVLRDRMPTREEFIEAEVRRRTAWTCFLMDSLLSGGKGRKRSLTASDMEIQLPCERENFVFGEPTCTERLDEDIKMPPVSVQIGELGTIAYSMRAANIWGKVARWACTEDFKTELPWSPTSRVQELMAELRKWKYSLPQRLHYDLFALHSHYAVDQGQAFCYMHCIHFMSYMFVHRAYLSVLGPQFNGKSADVKPYLYDEHTDEWKLWQKTSRKELFNESYMVLEMLEEMRTFGVYFLRGLVPWIGFTIYTAVGVMLYCSSFPSPDDDPRMRKAAPRCVKTGCSFLNEMTTQWPMAETWFGTIKRMQVYYRAVLSQDGRTLQEERKELQHAIQDYGYLQPQPVQKPVDTSKALDTSVVASSLSPTQSHHNKPLQTVIRNQIAMSPLNSAASPNGFTSNLPWTSPSYVPLAEVDETWNIDSFDISNLSNADLDEMMANAKDFWGSFPGEVGVGYQ